MIRQGGPDEGGPGDSVPLISDFVSSLSLTLGGVNELRKAAIASPGARGMRYGLSLELIRPWSFGAPFGLPRQNTPASRSVAMTRTSFSRDLEAK